NEYSLRLGGEIAEGRNVGDDERRAARHRFEQRHAKRRARRRTQVDVGAAVETGPAAVDVADEVDAGSEPAARALDAPAPRSVPDDGEMHRRMALEDARHRGEHRPKIIARLDPSEPQQPRPVGASTQAGTEERRVHAVRNDLPWRREIARHRIPRGTTDRNWG